jgi:hypothetical protein
MSQKPVFPGTYQQWLRLPQIERVYYTAPPYKPPQQQQTHPAIPLPTSYWQLGTEVPGSQPYVSGKVSKPTAVAPEGYVISEVKPVTIEKEGPGSRVPFEQQALQVTFKEKPKPLGLGESAYVATRIFQEAILQRTGQKGKFLETFLEVGPLSQAYFASGAVGAIESNVLGMASLGTSIYESARTGRLQYKPALDIKTSPTVISASVSALFGAPQEAREWEARPLPYKWGTIFGEASYIFLTSEAGSRLWIKIRGIKVSKLTAATEEGIMATTKEGVAAERTTNLILTTERVPPEYAEYLKEMSRFYTPEKIEFGGTTKLLIEGSDEALFTSKAALSFREATPYISATKYAVEHPPSLLTRIGAKLGLTTIPKVAVTEEMIAKGVFFETIQYKESTYTAIQIFGKIDRQIFIDLAKNVPPKIAQSFYYQMGGVSTQILEKVPTQTIPLMTQIVGYSIPRGTGAFALGAATTLIPKIGKKSTITLSLIIPQMKQTFPSLIMPKPLTRITEPINVSFGVTQRTNPLTMPRIATATMPKQALKTTPEQKLIPTTIPTPSIPTPIIPKVPPFWSRGGGEFSTISLKNLSGKWFPRKHPIKTWEAQLKTFGFGGKIPKSVSRLGKMEVPKGFKFGAPKTRRRRRKR